jgi:hypothetical protein
MKLDGTTSIIKFGDLQVRLRESDDRLALLNSAEGESLLRDEIEGVLKKGVRLVAVDVFDTVLVRSPVSELRRFWEFARAQLPFLPGAGETDGRILDILGARLAAARAAYRTGPRIGWSREGRFVDILRSTAEGVGVPASEELLGQLAEAELGLEADRFTSANGSLWDILLDLDQQGIEVVLMSDMYLHAVNIRRLLDMHGLGLRNLHVFTSADVVHNKRTGSVFPWLAERFGVEPAECLHIGDNPKSDFEKPIFAGWSARLLPISNKEATLITQDHVETIDELESRGFSLPVGWAEPGIRR